jgi:hypothetical protein
MRLALERISRKMKAKCALAVRLVEGLADALQSLSASWDCSDIQNVDVTIDLAEMLANFSDSCLKVLGA